MGKYLDQDGLSNVWQRIKDLIGINIDVSDSTTDGTLTLVCSDEETVFEQDVDEGTITMSK